MSDLTEMTPAEIDDRLAVVGPRRVGIVANNLPAARRRQGDRSFGEWQTSRAGTVDA